MISLRISGVICPQVFVEEGSQRLPSSRTDAYLSTTKVEKKGHVVTSATTITHLLPSEHGNTSSQTTTTNLLYYIATSQKPNPFQGEAETQMVNTKAQLSH